MDDFAGPWGECEDKARKAFELYDDDKHTEALSNLEEAIEINPNNSSWLFNKGIILNSLNHFDDAIEAFEQANELNPDDPVILNSLGIDYTRTGQYELALETFEKIQEIAPDFEKSYCSRIILFIEQGNHDKAEEMFYLARQLKEDCEVCSYNIGNSLFIRELYDQAIRCWKKTKSINPTHPQIDYCIGQAYWAKGDYKQAKKYLMSELRKNTTDTYILLRYSLLLLEMDELQQAQGHLEFILELEPNNGYAHHYLGELHLCKGNIDDAVKSFQKALDVKPIMEGAHYRLGQCHLKLGQPQNAKVHLLKEVEGGGPDNSDVLIDLGALLYEVGSKEEAIHCFLRAIDTSPKDYRAFHNLSCYQYGKGSLNEGIEFSLAALEQNPKHLPPLENLIHAHLLNGEIEKAKDYMKTATKYFPGNKKLRSLRKKILFSKLAHMLKIGSGSDLTKITEKMKKTMLMEHSEIEWYPHQIPNCRYWKSKKLNLSPPLMVRKAEWRR